MIYRFLSPTQMPLFARIAIERLDRDSALRTGPQLLALLEAYAKTYGEPFDFDDGDTGESIASSADHWCAERYSDYMP